MICYAEEIEKDGGPSAQPQSARVFVVEDDEELAELMRLELEGYAVEVATSVAAARSRMQAGAALDRVISDVRLPGESGVGLLFDEDSDASRPPVLIMSGFASKELRECIEGTGAMILEEPFSSGGLHASVLRMLAKGARATAGEPSRGSAR